MGKFETELAKLNAAQKKAVLTTEGPVLVIAGPGTGKTQLLSMRVANIMKVTDTDAANILCLTFTNKAAINMRERLLSLAGTESNKATVKTFHSFAAELMNQYPDYFWNGARLSTAPDAVQLEVIQNILSRLPLSNPLSMRFAGQFTGVDDTLKALRLAKEAGLTPNKLRAIIQANLAYIDLIEPHLTGLLSQTLSAKKIEPLKKSVYELPEQGIDASIAPLISLRTVICESFDAAVAADEGTNKTKNVGKWKTRWVQNQNGQKGMFHERKRNDWWLAFCDVYEKYRNELHRHGYYDYSDMLLEVIVQLEQNPDFLADVQERFQYVLLDEFQDSNAAQLRLAHLVADHHSSEGLPNIMAVGDDDQSIFGFNGAELKNMLFFDRNYKSVIKIILEDNYRSSQTILDTAEKIINQSDDRLINRVPGLSKKLIARNPPAAKGEIKHLSYPTREHQLSEVARQIKKQKKQAPNDSITVLARGHESLRLLSAILLEIDVPVRYEQQNNILEHEVIKQVILICETVAAIANGNKNLTNQKVAEVVRHPMWHITDSQLWNLATQNFRSSDWLDSLRSSSDLAQKQLGDWLVWLSREASYQPLAITLEHVLGLTASEHLTSPIREHYLTERKITNDYLHSLSAVRLLREMVNEFSSGTESSIDDFLRFIKINTENGRGITDESMFVSNHNAVELYTVHKAKGLEFDRVYIIDAIEDNWKPRTAGRKPPANLPLQPPGEQDDDYIRLLYVAATRAKHSLTVTSYRINHAGADVLASPFISEVIPAEIIEDGQEQEIQILEENLRWPRLTPKDEKANLAPRLDNYKLNATHLLNFLDVAHCGPQYFFERHLLCIPEAKTANQGFGNAMHRAMQTAQNLTNQKDFDIAKIQDAYDHALKAERLDQTDYEKYLQYGHQTLTKLFNDLGFTLPAQGIAEQKIDSIHLKQALLTGVLDQVSEKADSVVITTYKTGAPLSSFSTRNQAKAIKAWRHQSQLTFYALLYQKWPATELNKNLMCQIIYLEAETEKDLIRTHQPSSEEIDRMERLANAVWNKIINLDFPDTSQYSPDITGIKQFEEDLLNGY